MTEQSADAPATRLPGMDAAPKSAGTHPDAAVTWTRALTARRLTLLLVPLLVVTVLDRLSKLWISLNVWDPPRNIVIVSGWLEITPVANRGIAFGLLQETGGVLAVVTVVVLAGLAAWKWRQLLAATVLVRITLGMIAGGAIGNMIDRAQLGYVVDFIHVPRIWIFQVFNVADASIVVGTIALTLLLGPIAPRRPPPTPASPPGAPGGPAEKPV